MAPCGFGLEDLHDITLASSLKCSTLWSDLIEQTRELSRSFPVLKLIILNDEHLSTSPRA